jgi:NAD-dependent dihydropyrimidine dehydrogenase PreA subunit
VEPIIQLNLGKLKSLTRDEKKGWVDSCPTKVFQYDEIKEEVSVAQPEKCTYCDECVKDGRKRISYGGGDYDDLVTIRMSQDVFHFTVEVRPSLSLHSQLFSCSPQLSSPQELSHQKRSSLWLLEYWRRSSPHSNSAWSSPPQSRAAIKRRKVAISY